MADTGSEIIVGHVCFQCLPMKIITYIVDAKDLTVSVKRRTDLGKCDICKNNNASFQVTYTPRERIEISEKCIPSPQCTCGIGVTLTCPLHPPSNENSTSANNTTSVRYI